MDVIPYIYLTYMFISLYFMAFYFLLYVRNHDRLFDCPELKKHFSVSVLIPAYNEERSIKQTVEAVLKSDYDNIVEVIVLDNNSTDNTFRIARQLARRYGKVRAVLARKQGKANALNFGINLARGELVAVVDADSFPRSDAIRKLVGFFEEKDVGVATCPILVRNRSKFFGRMQAMEYCIIAATRKLLEGIGAIYVTPGPLALYRKAALKDVGGFDRNNLTEDIEITWRLASRDWARKMCLDTNVTTIAPEKIRLWWRQRKRWAMGGMQTIGKYFHMFAGKNVVGFFVLPFFILNTFLGLVGLSVFTYLMATRLIKQYLVVHFSSLAGTSVVTLNSLYFTPSVLNYLGIILFLIGTMFSFAILTLLREDFLKKSYFTLFCYLLFYLILYPMVLVTAIFKLIRKDRTW